jgi:hypothetical protein
VRTALIAIKKAYVDTMAGGSTLAIAVRRDIVEQG